jgi:uncharacterized repeat protein (TIGR03803 family)
MSSKSGFSNLPICAAGVALTLLASASGQAATEKTIYSFGEQAGDGGRPYSGLLNVHGIFYGVNYWHGAYGQGTFYSVTPQGAETVIHSFRGTKGNHPGGYVTKVGARFYGTTGMGGAYNQGVVYRIDRAGHEKVLYSFGAQAGDGNHPWLGLINVGGTFYGTTAYGGPNSCGGDGCGTVFSVTPSGAETVLHAFQGRSDGQVPQSALINVGGTLYGTTTEGGVNGFGTVFSVTPQGVETVLYSFRGGNDGIDPAATLINVAGTLYGTTVGGGAHGDGTVFEITTAGNETVLYSFGAKKNDGANPYAELLNVNNRLYGTTTNGGALHSGTVYRVTLQGAERVLHSFANDADDGGFPSPGLIRVHGVLYGTTAMGGAGGDGTVFAVTP